MKAATMKDIRPLSFEEAKRIYVHRFTVEHIPTWAKEPRLHPDNTYSFYAPQYASDEEWYCNTVFPGEGELHRNSPHCYSYAQTWPLGKDLKKPYAKA